MTTTYTVAQALATNATGILVVDTAANIASNLSNASLVSRVTLFSMNGNDGVAAWQAAALAAIGAQFSTAGYTLTVRDTVAQLTAAGNAVGLTISGILVSVSDTAIDVLNAYSNPIIRNANSVALTANATLTLAQLLMLESLSNFSAAGLTLTLSDSATNLLAFTPGEAKPALSVFEVGISSTVTAAQAITLGGMEHFGIVNGVTLTISDSLADLASDATSLHTVLALSGVVVNASDTLSDLLTLGPTFHWSGYPGVSVTLSNSGTVVVSQAVTLAGFPNFTIKSGQSLTIADTVAHLVTLTNTQAAIATEITLNGNATASVAQLSSLAALPHFVPSYTLTVDDTLAALATLTGPEHALVSAETIDDTVTNLLAAQPSALSGASTFVAELDGNTLDAAQAAALAALSESATLTLHANGTASTLTIEDTSAALSGAAASIATLEADGPVTVDTIETIDRTILTASAAAALVEADTNLSSYALAVADTGSALSAVASYIFGQGFEAITVTSGIFAGTMAQLLDPTLHFISGSAAQLNAHAGANVAQALELAALPSFSRATNVTLVVTDSITDILAAAAALSAVATSILANDTESVSAAAAATLATLTGFSLNGYHLLLDDTAANLAAATAGAITLATSVNLTSDARISEATALQFVAMGSKFSPNGFFVTIADTAGNLETLAGSSPTLATVNGWSGEAVLTANASVSVANATALNQLTGFNVGIYHLTLSDSAGDLLGASGSVLALAYAAQLSQASTVTAANAATLEALPRFSDNSLLTISDTPAALAAMAASLATPASLVSLATEVTGNGGNSAAYAINATQFAAMLALPHFSLAGFTGTVAVTDTATSLLALASSLSGLSSPVLSHITVTLGTPATVTVATAEALHALPDFSVGGSALTISDTATALATLDAGTASLASTIELSAPVTVSVATAAILAGLHDFTTDPNAITIVDTAANLATLGSPASAIASTIGLQDSALTSVANFVAIRALSNYSNDGNVLVVSDTEAHLLELVGTNVSLAAAIMLSTTATNLSAATAEQLATLSNFTTGIAHLTILDSAADLLLTTDGGSQLEDWTGELAASSVTLSGNATVSAAQAAQLALLGTRFSVGSYTLTVSDGAADLLASANAGGLALAGAITLSGNETALSAANATQLAALAHFSKGGYEVTVSDTAADLAFSGYASGLALADHVQLSQAASTTVTAAEALIGMQTFQVNADAAITITDTLPDLLGLATANLSFHSSVLATTAIALSENAVATAAQIEALAALPQYGSFSTNSHTLTVADSGEDLASLTPEQVAAAGSVVMIGDAVLTATQADALAALSVNLAGYKLIVSDTAAALLSGSNTSGVGIATALTLSGATVVDAADATSLFDNSLFSTGGHTLTISDTPSALLALGETPSQAATTLELSESGDVVLVSQLVQLAELGSKFSLNQHTLTVSDSATHLATLNNLETALVSSAVLDQDATVNTTTATALATLPAFALGHDITLTVQGSYAQLEALPGSITSIATLELTGGAQTLTAAEAANLAGLSNFTAGADIVVQDTIGDLNAGADAGWQTVATGGYIVTDSISNLLDNASSQLLADANNVTLLGDAQVDAATFATLAGIANFSRGTFALTVEDGAVAIANNATEIGLLASSALIDSAAPVSAPQAEALANLNSAHMLSFTGGVSLAVQDSFGALTSAGNAAGLALASSVTVLGTGAQLATATAHDWGSIQPYYELNASGDISGPQANTLQALGGHFLPDNYTLTVTDNAAGVVDNATAIEALGILAQVTDSASGVDAEAGALGALGSTLQSITLTDTNPVAAESAGELAPLVSKLTGPAITVSDSASAVNTYLADLETLGAHLSSVTVSDSAADVAGVASDLSGLGSKLHIALTDDTPISVAANIAAGLVPVGGDLGGTTISVSDIAAHIVTYASDLADLGTVLGTVTLSDGTAINASTAAALAPIAGHLGTDVTFSVTDTAEAIADAATGLGTMEDADRPSSIVAGNETVDDVLTYGATLASLGATATIHDSAAHVSANLDALELLSGYGGVVTGITLNDGGTPDITVSLLQLTSDATVLGLISSGFKYAINDTSANIVGDLGDAGSSHILTLGSAVDTITVSDSDTLTLTATTLLATGVDDGAGSALTRLANGTSVVVTDATIADFADFAALSVAPTSFAIADTGYHIGQDLGSETSVLLANRTSITGITPGGTITLDYATESEAHVNDGAGSVFSKMAGATLDVTGVPVTDIAGLFTTGVHASSITVTDSAGDIAGDLGGASPTLVTYISEISAIAASPSGTITLYADHALAGGVDDGSGSVLGKMSGGTLAVTGAMVDQLDALHALYQLPVSVAVSDAASTIETDLMNGATSLLEIYASDGMVAGIATTGGPVVLDDSYIVPAISAALAQLSADSLQVTNVPLADVVTVSDLHAFASMTVSDAAATIQGDLVAAGAHLLETDHAEITAIAVSDDGVVTLDYSDAGAVPDALALLPSGSLSVTAVPVTGIASLAAITALTGMTVADSAAAIATDLRRGEDDSKIDLNAAKITSVTVTGSNAAAADAAELSSLTSKLTGSAITVSDTAAAVNTNLAGLEALGTHLGSVTVSDSAAQVEAVATAISALGSKLHITLTDETPISVSADVAAGLVPVDTNLGSSVINVSDTGGAIAADATTLAQLGDVLGTVTVSDGTTLNAATAAGLTPVASNLAHDALDVSDTAAAIDTHHVALETLKADGKLQHVTASSDTAANIVAHGTALTALGATTTISDSGAGVLADLDQLQTLVTAGVVTGIALNDESTPTLTISLTQLTDDGGVLALIGVAAHLAINDTGGEVQGDLRLGGDSLIAASDGVITGITLSSGSVSLSDGQADAVATEALNLLPLDSLTVTGVPVSDVATIAGLTALSGMTVLDDSGTIHDELVTDGASSPLEVYASMITSIGFSSGASTFSLSDTQAQPVLDALAKLPSGSLSVTGVSLADIAAIAGLAPVLTSMTVSADSGAVLTSLEVGASSPLEAHASKITAISFSSGASQITLPDADVTAVSDALALLPADSLVVTGVSVANIASRAEISSLASMTVSDGGGEIQGNLTGDTPSLNTDVQSGLVTSIAVNDAGTIALTAAEAAAADTAGVLANLSLDGGSLTVSGVLVADIATVLAYPNVTSIALNDTGELIRANLATGTTIADNIGAISHITDNDGYAISLTDSQIQAAGVDAAVGKLSGGDVIVTDVPITDIDTIASLAHLPTSMIVSDSALDVQNDLTEVGAASHLRAHVGLISEIDLSDGGTPTIALSMANLTLNSTELSLISTTPYDLAISDTSTNIENDLNNVTSTGSFLLVHLAALSAITVSDTGATIILTAAAALTTGIDDDAGSVFAKMTGYGHLEVDGVAATAIDTVLGLYVAPTHITVSDTAADIATDLNKGADSSAILGNLSTIDSITASDDLPVGITVVTAELAGVADNAVTSVMAKLAGHNFVVTDAEVTDVATLIDLTMAPSSIDISDSAGDIQSDLAGAGVLVAQHTVIGTITVGGGTITLTVAELTATGVDDGAGSVFAKISGLDHLAVSGVAVDQITSVTTGLSVVPDQIQVLDSTENLQSDLISGTYILPAISHISEISLDDAGPIMLTAAEATMAAAAVAVLDHATLEITGVAVADVHATALLNALATMTVSDSTSDIHNDLALAVSSTSKLENNAAKISSIAVNDDGVVSLTDTQAQAALAALAEMTAGTLTVTDVSVTHANSIFALAAVTAGTGITVSDTAGDIQDDLVLGGSSKLLTDLAKITSIAVSDSNYVTLASADTAAVTTVLAKLGEGTLEVTGVAVADVPTVAGFTALHSMTVSDTALDVQNDLTEVGAASHLRAHVGLISEIDLTDGGTPTIALSMANLTLDSTELSLISEMPYDLAISDTSTNIENDLNNVTSTGSFLLVHLAALSAITVSDTGATIILTAAAALTTGIDDDAGSVFAKMTGYGHLEVDGVAATAIDSVLGLYVTPTHITVSDTAADIATDLNKGADSSAILGNLSTIDSITASDDLPVGITVVTAELAGVADNAVTSVMAKLAGHNFVVTDAEVTDVATLIDLTMAPSSIDISDSAGDIQSDLAGAGVLVAQHTVIGTITVGGGTITLTVAELTATGVDDGAGSVFAKISGLDHLAVSGVAVDQITSVTTGLSVVPDQIQVLDSTENLQSDLISGTYILPAISHISEISLDDAGPIMLTAAEATTAAAAVAVLDAATLEITGVAVADVHATALLNALATMTVSDSTSDIHNDLALAVSSTSKLENNAAKISSIAVNDDGVVSLTDTQAQAALAALAEMTAGTLTVTDVSVTHANSIFALAAVTAGTGMTVSDTAGDIQDDLVLGGSSKLLTDLAKITSIAVSDANLVSLSVADAAAVSTVLAKLGDDTLGVTGVALTNFAAVTAYAALDTMTVSDTVGTITTDLQSGTSDSQLEHYASQITSITATGGSVALSDTDAWAVTAALDKLVADSLTISDAVVAHVASYGALTGLTSMTVADTGGAIATSLAQGADSVIETYLSQISLITPSGTVSLNDSQADTVFSALAKLSDDSLIVTDVPVSDVAHIASLGSILVPASMLVQDYASNVQNDLTGSATLVTAASAIDRISLTGGGDVTLTDAQADSALAVLGKLPEDSLIVTGVPVSDIATIAALSSLDHMTVVDSTAHITGDVNGAGIIASNIGSISSVAINGTSIDATDATTIYSAVGSKFVESALTISDTASALISAHASEPGMLTAALHVTLSASATGVTAANATTLDAILGGSLGGKTLAVADTASDLLNEANAAGIDLATEVQLSATLTTNAATATELAGLHAFTAGPAVTVQDSPTNLLDAAYAAGLAIATTVEPDQAYIVTATTLAALASISGFSAGGQSITVAGHASDIIGLSPTALSFTTLAHVTDSSATIAADLGALQSAVSSHDDAMSITLTDGTPNTPTIFIDAATYAADQGAIDSISTAGAVNVTDGAAALAAIASELASDSVVGDVEVDDSAANILANLTALESIGSKLGNVTITDSSLNASEVAALLTIPNLQTGAVTISDTGSQIAAAIEANGQAGLDFLNAQTVALSGNSVIAASDAVLLEELTNLNKGSYALVVWDTASHLTDSVDGYLAAEKNSLITAVYLKTTTGTATITAATAATLLSIPTFSKDNPPISLGGTGTSNTLTVSDTAAHIEAEFSALHGHTSSLSSVVVSGSATVAESVYSDLLTLGAIMAGGTSLTVRDTAATIISDAPGQLGGAHSITPAAWQISGSATVSESGAAYLGGLAGFSAGAYTLTLSASDATTSESDANAIGVLGSAFHLGGYQLTVSGTVSYVSGLSTNARMIVTSDITDTFSQIATLTLGDNLLDGTITVNDSEAITTTQASDFLALLGGSGIPTSKVSFGGNVESITDTLSNIQTLTGSADWTSNTGVHGDFSLVVADTVANLINPSNTTALAGMHATTLNGNQTVSAANAESLFAVESTINFSLGSYTITIQDSAAALLNPSNSDGEAIATVWQLASPDSVNTAGAETLLPDSQFHLNHLLTVSDTSDNLLDGILSGVISAADSADAGYGGSVHVTLSDAEQLDANTAEVLVSLPGFQNTGELSIADDSSYLLNPNNLTAETDATSVTLAGDETMSAATMGKLAALPNFTLGENIVTLASNDYANAATLKAIADFGSGYQSGGFSLTMTQDNITLTPNEYTALQSDDVVQNGHALSAIPIGASVSSSGGNVFLTATGVSGATLNVYAASGSDLHSSTLGTASISVTQADAFGTVGGAVVITETMPSHSAATAESAPLIAIDQTVITTDAGEASFASTGGANSVQVGTNEYMQLYTAGSQPASPANPVLVYDPSAHTLSFDVASTSVVLVTLGAQTHPASLNPAEIFITHFV